MSQNDYILFYSMKCLHCKELLVLFEKDPELNRKFIKVNIDTRGTNIPKYIKSVPSAIIPLNGRSSLLVGKNIFKWYEDTHKVNVESNEIMDYDPMGMTGYSDNFSFLTDLNPLKKAYAFLDENFGGVSNIVDQRDVSNSSKEKETEKSKELSAAFEKMMNARKHEVPQPIARL